MEVPTWCPLCGYDVNVDAEGCCEECGNGAHGEGAEQAVDAHEWRLRWYPVVAALREQHELAERLGWHVTTEEQWRQVVAAQDRLTEAFRVAEAKGDR